MIVTVPLAWPVVNDCTHTLAEHLKIQESLANAKETRDSSAFMKAHCPLRCPR